MYRYTLIGTELSLYTGKIKTYLQWKGVPFDVMLPSDDIYRKILIPRAGIAMIPVLLIYSNDDDISTGSFTTLQDTKDIMDYFETTYPAPKRYSSLLATPMQHPIVPRTPQRAFAAQLMELLADEWLVTQAMYWRWYEPHLAKQWKFLAAEFGNSSTGGLATTASQQEIGGKRMAKFAGFTPGLGVSDTTSPALEWQFRELLKLMEEHFDRFPFLLGNEISLADFAFWGPFGPHLGRDPVPSFIIKTTAPAVWEWVERVNSCHRWGGQHVSAAGSTASSYGTSKPHADRLNEDGDELPGTTSKILSFLLNDYSKVLLTTVERTAQYIAKKGGDKIALPRSLGEHLFALSGPEGDCEATRRAQTHCVWELDRIIARSKLSSADRTLIDWLQSVCGPATADIVGKAFDIWLSTGRRIEREQATLVAVLSSGHISKL